MRRNLPRYVEHIRSKQHDYYYFRRSRTGPRFRLPGEPGSREFEVAYVRRLGAPNPLPSRSPAGSVGAMVRDYLSSDEYRSLKPKTQRGYARMLELFAPLHGVPAENIKRRHIRELRISLQGMGRTQQLFSQVTSVLFNFGVDNDYCSINPAARMKRVDRVRSYAAWSEEQCTTFEASKPPRELMSAYMLGRYTGQRRSDVLKMTRAAYDGEGIQVLQQKTRQAVWIPVHARLRTYLDVLPKDALLLVTNSNSRPVEESKFSKGFRTWLDAHGLPGLHFHGLRHAAGRALAEAGCSTKEIQAILGHRTAQMVELYSKAAQQKRLARAAIAKLERTGTEQESPKLGERFPNEGDCE
jgi:integrase